MLNVRTKAGVQELHERLQSSREELEPFLTSRLSSIRKFLGSLYGPKDPAELETIYNLLNQFVETYVLLLTGGEVKAGVSTVDRDLKATGARLRAGLNAVISEIHLTETIRLCTIDAMFGHGIAQVYMTEGRQAEAENDTWIEVGRPHAKRISPDDFVYDMSRSRWSEIRFAADEYELPIEYILDDDFYNRKRAKQLEPQAKGDGKIQAKDISTGQRDDPAARSKYATLMNVWLPEKGEIAVMARYNPDLLPLAIVEWDGSNDGPYKRLLFSDAPDNIEPSAPTNQLKPIHVTLQRLLAKLITQAEAQKTINWYEASASQDARKLRDAADLEGIKVINGKAMGVYEFGGPNAPNLALAIQLLQLGDRLGGNLSSLAGLGPQAGTLGQEEMIYGQASSKLAKFNEKVLSFSDSVLTELAKLIWEDEAAEIKAEMADPILGSLPYHWSSSYRKGDFNAHVFSIDPYRLGYESPQAKLGKLERFIQTVMGMWPAFQAAGAVLDVQQFVEEWTRLANMETQKSIVMFPTDRQMDEDPSGGKMAPHTIRENVRRNVSAGPTNQESDRMMMEALRTARPQGNGQQQGGPMMMG